MFAPHGKNHQVGHNTDVNQEVPDPFHTEMAGGGEPSIQPILVHPHTTEVTEVTNEALCEVCHALGVTGQDRPFPPSTPGAEALLIPS